MERKIQSLSVISSDINENVLNKLISETWEHGIISENKLNGRSSQIIKQILNKSTW